MGNVAKLQTELNEMIVDIVRRMVEDMAMSYEYSAREYRDLFSLRLGDDIVSRVWVDIAPQQDGVVDKNMIMQNVAKFMAAELREKIIGYTGNNRKNHIRLNVEQKVIGGKND